MKLAIKKGTTSKLLDIFISDSSSTTGAGLTGLLYNSAGLTAYYYREGAATATAITLTTMTLGTWATGGFVVVDGTNMPGCYQLGIPDAAFAAGANSVIVMLKGATNMAPLVIEIQLTDVDLHDAVRGGMTALPNAAAGGNGGLPTVDASNKVAGLQGITFPGNFGSMAITAGGAVTVGTNNDKTGYSITAGDDAAIAAAVWGAATRTLTSGANIVLAKGTGVTGFNDIAAPDILTTALVESYAIDGAAFTLSQALYMIWSALSEFAVNGTTITAKKLDGVTPAMTFTMDSATLPTSRTRAT